MILDRILEHKRTDVQRLKQERPLPTLIQQIHRAPPPRGLARALGQGGTVRLLAECKHRSPSKGVLREPFDPVALAVGYCAAGADAVSVLTDAPFFGGSFDHLRAVRAAVPVPVLCKDFVVDEYQVAAARAAGADGVLLIAAVLGDAELRRLVDAVERWGMDALVEVHTETELERALAAGARLVGVNNRDLRTFETSLEVTLRLAPRVPPDVTLVSESGIRRRSDVERVAAAGVDAVLVGEGLVTAEDPGAAARRLVGVPASGRARREVASG